MVSDDNLFFAILLTLLAGISTGVGGLLVFSKHARKDKFLAAALGLAAGAMIYISFVELLFGALEAFQERGKDESEAYTRMTLMFLGGLIATGLFARLMVYVMDKLGVDTTGVEDLVDQDTDEGKSKQLYRAGIITAIALAIHNLPEGLVTFLTTMQDLNLGIGIAIAIAIHNVPEGLAVALPIYYATKSRKKALTITLLAGLSEPVGAGIAYFLFFENAEQETFEIVNVFVASIMVYVAFFELIPTAAKLNHPTRFKWGLIAGMTIMGVSLIFLT